MTADGNCYRTVKNGQQTPALTFTSASKHTYTQQSA